MVLCKETFKECTTQCKGQADFKLQYHTLKQYILILIAFEHKPGCDCSFDESASDSVFMCFSRNETTSSSLRLYKLRIYKELVK